MATLAILLPLLPVVAGVLEPPLGTGGQPPEVGLGSLQDLCSDQDRFLFRKEKNLEKDSLAKVWL